jgi:NAD(P)-dependent dehydrogenase (short-subunit alcohol dehydrogenase family)
LYQNDPSLRPSHDRSSTRPRYVLPSPSLLLLLLSAISSSSPSSPQSILSPHYPPSYASFPPQVVNIGSISGLVSNPFSGVYAATKKALHALTETLRQELYPFDVNVMLVAPGIIKSQLEIKASASTRGERGVKEGSLWQMVEKQAWFIKTMVRFFSGLRCLLIAVR